jgi:hypothetical protein
MVKSRRTENRIESIQEGKDKKDLTIITYQTYVGGIPQGTPWKSFINYEDFQVLKLRWILHSEFMVPDNFIDKFESAVRESKERSDIDNDLYAFRD